MYLDFKKVLVECPCVATEPQVYFPITGVNIQWKHHLAKEISCNFDQSNSHALVLSSFLFSTFYPFPFFPNLLLHSRPMVLPSLCADDQHNLSNTKKVFFTSKLVVVYVVLG
jgi:hypothetical protein